MQLSPYFKVEFVCCKYTASWPSKRLLLLYVIIYLRHLLAFLPFTYLPSEAYYLGKIRSKGMVIVGDSYLRGRQFESQCRILDGSFSHLFVVKLYYWWAMIVAGQWLWLSWQSGCLQYQRSVVQIQSSAKFYTYTANCWKDENTKKKEAVSGRCFKIVLLFEKAENRPEEANLK